VADRGRPLLLDYDFRPVGGPALRAADIEAALAEVSAGRPPPPWWSGFELFLATVRPLPHEKFVRVPGLGDLYPYDYALLQGAFGLPRQPLPVESTPPPAPVAIAPARRRLPSWSESPQFARFFEAPAKAAAPPAPVVVAAEPLRRARRRAARLTAQVGALEAIEREAREAAGPSHRDPSTAAGSGALAELYQRSGGRCGRCGAGDQLAPDWERGALLCHRCRQALHAAAERRWRCADCGNAEELLYDHPAAAAIAGRSARTVPALALLCGACSRRRRGG
jgi:hypothetical protein